MARLQLPVNVIIVGTLIAVCYATIPLKIGVLDSHKGGIIPAQCINCTYVQRGRYYQTDMRGLEVLSFDCSNNDVTESFCTNPNRPTIPAVIPDPVSQCRSKQKRVSCFNDESNRYTLWGDGRSDPSYYGLPSTMAASQKAAFISGALRDFFVDDYTQLFGYNVNVTPSSSPSPTSGQPNIYSHYGYAPLSATIGMETHYATNMSRDYRNDNDKLFFYGSNADFRLLNDHAMASNCPSYSSRLQCIYKRFYEYLTSHKGIAIQDVTETAQLRWDVFTDLSVTLNNDFYARLQRAYPNCINGCKGLQPYKRVFGHLNIMNSFEDGYRFKAKYSAVDMSWYRGNVGAFFADPFFVAATMQYFDDDGNQLKYPVLLHPFGTAAWTRYQSPLLDYAEESVDGVIWTLHPHSNEKDVLDALQVRDWAKVKAFILSDRISSRHPSGSATAIPLKPLMCTGANVYMRTIQMSLYSQTQAGRDARAHVYMTYKVMHATDFAPVKLYVAPSMGATRSQSYLTVYKQCISVPLCTYIAPPFDSYPDDATTVVNGISYGSLTMKNYMRNRVLPVLYGYCEMIVPSYIEDFLDSPSIKPTKCIRVDYDMTVDTCFMYNTSTFAGSSPLVDVDVLRTTAVYHKRGFKISVYSQKAPLLNYTVPTVILGPPFTPTNHVPMVYVYDRPAAGSIKIGNLYITRRQVCEVGPYTQGRIDNQCECVDYPLAAAYCLCKDLESYKELSNIPAGTTFTYPAHFKVVSVPTNYTIVNNQLAYDSDLFTIINIDCPTFLCSNNAECVERLKRSNYLTFCDNQKVILTTSLNALRGVTADVSRSVNEYLAKFTVDMAHTNVSTLPPLSGVPPAAQSNDSLSGALSSYYNVLAKEDIETPLPSYPKGYNYRNPLTTPGEAFGLSIAPAVGVGLLTEKINSLAVQNQIHTDRINYLGSKITQLANNVRDGLIATYNAVSKLAVAHNTLVTEMNANFAIQNIYNLELANAINAISAQVTANADSINFLDLISARADTLALQTSAILVKAADQLARGREFQLRIDACTSPESASAALCSSSRNGILLSTAVRRMGSTTILDSVVMEPDNYTYVYGAPEFCYNNTHYTVLNSQYIFVFLDNVVYVTTKNLWDPKPMSPFNSVSFTRCRTSKLIINDLTPGVPVVPLDTVTVVSLESNITTASVNITPALLKEIDEYVNITGELAALNNTIKDLIVFEVEKFAPTLLELGGFGSLSPSDLFNMGIASIVMASLSILATIGLGYLTIKSMIARKSYYSL